MRCMLQMMLGRAWFIELLISIFLATLLVPMAHAQPNGSAMGAGIEGGNGDGRGRIIDPRIRPQIIPKEELPLSQRDCPVVFEAYTNDYCKSHSIAECLRKTSFCQKFQDICLGDAKYNSQCKAEELVRAIARFNENIPKSLAVLKSVVSLANAAKPFVDSFTSSGGCADEYAKARASLDELNNASDTLRRLEIGMATDFNLAVGSGAIDKLVLSAIDGDDKLHIAVNGNMGKIILDVTPTLFPGPSWISVGLPGGFIGIELGWDTSALKIGKATLTTIPIEEHWREEPRFADFDGSPHESIKTLPEGTRYCNYSFELGETSLVCVASVEPSLDGLRIFAVIRGDERPFF